MSQKKEMNGHKSRGGDVPYMNPNKLVIVGIDTPKTAENWFAHCARLVDIDDAELADYAEFILNNGADHAVHAARDGLDALVIDGRTTTRAARLAWKIQEERGVPEDERVAVRVLFLPTRGSQEEQQEAWHRINVMSHKQRPLTKVQEARQVADYYTRVHEDKDKTAAKFGIHPKTVENHLALLSLDRSVQKAVTDGFPMAEAIKLADMPKADQKAKIAEIVASGAVKGAAAASAVRKVKKGQAVGTAEKVRKVSALVVDKFLTVAEKTGGYETLVAFARLLRGDKGAHKDLGEDIIALLSEAGWKEPGAKKEKAPKAAKAPKEKKEKVAKAPKKEKATKAKAEKPTKKAKAEGAPKRGRKVKAEAIVEPDDDAIDMDADDLADVADMDDAAGVPPEFDEMA